MSTNQYPDLEKVLFTREEIAERVRQLGEEITANYTNKGIDEIVVIAVLRGSFIFLADLVREIGIDTHVEFMAVSSYGATTKSSGVVRILKDLDADIKDKHVLVVEDIVDSGLTLSFLLRNLASRQPKSLELCSFLVKSEAIKVEVDIQYAGFEVPTDFLVGYGLDYAESYRNLPVVGVLKPEIYTH